MGAGPLVVTYPLTRRSRAIVEEELGGTAEAIYLVELAPAARAHALERAGAVLSHDTSKELRPDEIPLIRNARLLQFTAAGVDWVPTRDLPRGLPVAAGCGEAPVHRARQPQALRVRRQTRRDNDAAIVQKEEIRLAGGQLQGRVRQPAGNEERHQPIRLPCLGGADDA